MSTSRFSRRSRSVLLRPRSPRRDRLRSRRCVPARGSSHSAHPGRVPLGCPSRLAAGLGALGCRQPRDACGPSAWIGVIGPPLAIRCSFPYRQVGLSTATVFVGLLCPTKKLVSRSAGSRCLVRRGRPAPAAPFETVPMPGFLPLDVEKLRKLNKRCSFGAVGIDPTLRGVYAQVSDDRNPATAAGMGPLQAPPSAAHWIGTVLQPAGERRAGPGQALPSAARPPPASPLLRRAPALWSASSHTSHRPRQPGLGHAPLSPGPSPCSASAGYQPTNPPRRRRRRH